MLTKIESIVKCIWSQVVVEIALSVDKPQNSKSFVEYTDGHLQYTDGHLQYTEDQKWSPRLYISLANYSKKW